MFERNYLNYIIFFILSFLIIFGYATLFAPKPGKKKSIDQKEQTNVVDAVPTPSIQDIAIEEYVTPIVPLGKVITVRSPLFTGKIDTVGGRIIEWNLENYRETTSKDSPPVNLFKDSPPSYNSSLRLQGFQVPDIIPFEYDGDTEIIIDQKEQELRLSWKSNEGIEVMNIYIFKPNTYLVEQRFEVINNADSQITRNLSIEWFGRIEQEGRYKTYHNFRAMVSDKIENLDNPPKEALGFNGIINWFGFSSKYFLSAFLPEIGDETKLTVNSVGGNHLAKVTYTYPSSVVPSNNTSIRKSKLYLGPVEYEVLNTIGSGLQEAINYGWFGVLARPVGLFLKYINDYMHNYGISIIVITVIIRLLFLPLTIKSMGSMKEMQNKMQEIKPKIDALKEKFKDDKAKQNSELMKLYSSHGINPLSSLSGCLPLLIQLPVFIALYDVLLYSIDLRHSSFLWVNDLSEPENLFNIPFVGAPFRILPLAMGASWYISQKMTPTTTVGVDNMQLKMMQFMPLIFTVMFWGLPSGLILYWTVSNILSIVQQLYVNRRFKGTKGGVANADSSRKGRKDSI